jgi:hypothetical protein
MSKNNSSPLLFYSVKKDVKNVSKVITDEDILKKFIYDRKIQKEIIDHLCLKMQSTGSIRGQTSIKLLKTNSGQVKKANNTFIVMKKQKSQNEIDFQF